MQITRVPFELRRIDDPNRSKSLHLSELIREIGLDLGYIPPQYADEGTLDVTRISLGQSWEDFLSKYQHLGIDYHPGEITSKGISMSPDGLSFEFCEYRDDAIHEFKVTWKSMSKENDLDGQWLWMAQIMSYCLAAGVHVAYIHIYWVCGNYKDLRDPQYRIYRLVFTKAELVDMWGTITRYRDSRQGRKNAKVQMS